MPLFRNVIALTVFTSTTFLLPNSLAVAQSLEPLEPLEVGAWTQVFFRECGPPREFEVLPDCGAVQSELRVTDADLGVTGSATSTYIQAQPSSRSSASAGYAGGGFTPAISAYSSSALGERIITSAIVIQRYEFLADGDLTGTLDLTYSQTGIDQSLPFIRSPLGFLLSGVVIFRTENDLFEPEKCDVDDLTSGVALVTCITAEALSQKGDPAANPPIPPNPPGLIYEGALEFVNFEFDDTSPQVNATQSIPFSITGEAGDIVFLDADMFIFANNGGFGDSRTTLRIELDNPELVQASFPVETFAQAPRPVDTDIKPGSTPNSINPTSGQKIPVAILTTDAFDATQVDWETVSFGPGGAAESHGRAHVRDVDDDGDMDLLLHFDIPDSGIECSDKQATLTGETFDGEAITGVDSIVTVNCP